MLFLYNLLPDFSGIFLAALGVATFFAPSWVEKLGNGVRWSVAIVLVLLGIAGMQSSFAQHRRFDEVQAALGAHIAQLNTTLDSVKVKLDNIISDPHSTPNQKRDATDLKIKVEQSTRNSKCSGIVAGGNVSNACQ